MQMFDAAPGVAAGLSVASGAHHCHAERDQRVAQRRPFARAQDNSDLRKRDPQRANQLRQLAVTDRKERSKSASSRPKARQTDGDVGLPAAFQQIFEMRRERDRFILPAPQTKERADADPAKTGDVTALCAIEPVIKIAFRSSGMQFGVNRALISFLINSKPFRAGSDNGGIIRRFHRTDFDRDRREIRRQRAHAFGQIIATDKFRMFPRDQ